MAWHDDAGCLPRRLPGSPSGVSGHGASRGRCRAAPSPARLDSSDWKPMKTIGLGVREIRIRDKAGAYRVIYVVRRSEAVYVLHAFQKKTQQTAKKDLDLAAARLQQI
ncbi:type II toxin-antitoxin system RelE/ParE family toxin [Inquilinus ginsengisoli]|uniref:type II toxin-antitoxin system RelE/ParE family toxin n=1 Tax=Inquilinus ginsengisoli TaxID=363840 RepID=UPI003D1F9568